MKENPANAIKDTMWKLLMEKGQKSNERALRTGNGVFGYVRGLDWTR